MTPEEFSLPLLEWFDQHGRKDLPWQSPRSPYRVWISEIMLQQTQVKTVIPYFNQFMKTFPTIRELAKASEDKVLALWSGLGYYSRARNLHKTAKMICEHFDGQFPRDLANLSSLPGIGPSTAGAIASQAFNLATPILDGNVKRVLCRYFLIEGWPEQSSVKHKLWQLAKECMSLTRAADYTQAIMDLGATCCKSKNPGCPICPLQKGCLARQNQVVDQYPHKKIKKDLPLKQEQFLLLYDSAKRIYLEKRPPTGIWGGLWSMPSIDLLTSAQEYLGKTYELTCLTCEKLLFIRHSFSHFHLEIHALALEIKMNPNSLRECQGKWFREDEIKELGISKPVSKIINHFFNLAALSFPRRRESSQQT